MADLFPDASPDEDFPDRPDHPDFRLLSEIVQDMDAQADLGVPLDQLIDFDPASLFYLADQRLIRVSGTTRWYETMSPRLRQALIGFYLDAFSIGIGFERRRRGE